MASRARPACSVAIVRPTAPSTGGASGPFYRSLRLADPVECSPQLLARNFRRLAGSTLRPAGEIGLLFESTPFAIELCKASGNRRQILRGTGMLAVAGSGAIPSRRFVRTGGMEFGTGGDIEFGTRRR